jgi:hypothetical protein
MSCTVNFLKSNNKETNNFTDLSFFLYIEYNLIIKVGEEGSIRRRHGRAITGFGRERYYRVERHNFHRRILFIPSHLPHILLTPANSYTIFLL